MTASMSIPGTDVLWTTLAAVGLVLIMLAVAGWLIDHALLPVLRGFLHPARPWLERRWPASGEHTKEARGGKAVLDRDGTAHAARPAVAAPADLPALPGHEPVHQEAEDDLTTGDDYDTDTLAVFRAVNAEHHVKPHDPPPAPAHTRRGPGETPGLPGLRDTLPPGVAAGEAGRPGDQAQRRQPGGESGEPGAQAADPAVLDAWIERHRQQTVVDPVFGAWLADLLALDGLTNASYMQRMTQNLRAGAIQ